MTLGTYKYHTVFWLYQTLPRDSKQAMSPSELVALYVQACEASNTATRKRVKSNINNAIQALYEVIGEGLRRIPDWSEENISGRTPRYYLRADYYLDERINPETILLWQMVSQYTLNYLPLPIQQTINVRLDQLMQQRKILNTSHRHSPLVDWQQRIIALPSVTLAPDLNRSVLAIIHEALLKKQSLQINYCKKHDEHSHLRQIYPIGLVVMDNMLYLTGFNPCKEHIDSEVLLKNHRNFAVTRIKDAKLSTETVPDWVWRDEFSLSSLLAKGKLEPQGAETIMGDQNMQLVLCIQNHACLHLYERPLSHDQVIVPQCQDDGTPSGWSLLTATVTNTLRLQDWLVSMSQLAVVIEPVALRGKIRHRLQKGMGLYTQYP